MIEGFGKKLMGILAAGSIAAAGGMEYKDHVEREEVAGMALKEKEESAAEILRKIKVMRGEIMKLESDDTKMFLIYWKDVESYFEKITNDKGKLAKGAWSSLPEAGTIKKEAGEILDLFEQSQFVRKGIGNEGEDLHEKINIFRGLLE